MAKNSISDYDTTSGNNTDVQSVDISEGCAASGINNAIREVMTDMADAFTQGTPIKLDQTNNRVMINTTTEGFADYADTLTVADTDHAGITIRSGASSSGSLYFSDATSGSGEYDGYLNYNQSTQTLTVGTAAATRMTIDTNGHLLVAQTSFDTANVGHSLTTTGFAHHTRDGNIVMILNRKSSDGEILELRKNDSSVGVIGANGGDLFIRSANVGLVYQNAQDRILPCTSSGAARDNAIDLGEGGARFDDIFATNGSIQTSDQNEKQDIASLTTAEMTAAKAISKLFKTFKWQDKVAAKGDAARTHTGVIAQEVQTAMTDAGLDASNYAFWCSDTWWEASTEVAAVEADEEAGIEARDAYTRIDTYQTADEAPEGAKQRTRLGIRYAELLAFIGAATEQRLGDIETRLTALENA